jgi:DNA polymerase III epsilon subunit-like protein
MAAAAQQGKDWRDETFVVIDTETTGLDTQKDEPVEVALVFIEERLETTKMSALWYTPDHPPMSDKAFALHGISESDLKKTVTNATAGRSLLYYADRVAKTEKSIVVQWGNDFDYKMAQDVAPIDAIADRSTCPWIDVCSIVRYLEKGLAASYRLEDVAARYDIPLYRAHRALPDAEATGQILIHVLPKIPSKTRDEFLSFAKEASVWAEQDRLRAQQERKEQPKAKNAGVKRSSPEPTAAAAAARPQKTTKRVFEVDPDGPKCLKCQGPSTIAECGSGKNKGKEAWFCHRKRNGLPGTTEACGFIKIVS